MWGETRYYTPSRFLSEIPDNLTERNVPDDSVSYNNGGTFKQAVNKIKTDRSGYVEKSTSFGKGFIAPTSVQNTQSISKVVKKKPVYNGESYNAHSSYKPLSSSKQNNFVKRDAFVVKNAQNQAKDEEKIKKLLEDNPIKRMLEEKKAKEAAAAAQSENKTDYTIGDRVFHGKFGIGHISEIKEIGSSKMYIIDFGNHGRKAVDALYSNLKKF